MSFFLMFLNKIQSSVIDNMPSCHIPYQIRIFMISWGRFWLLWCCSGTRFFPFTLGKRRRKTEESSDSVIDNMPSCHIPYQIRIFMISHFNCLHVGSRFSPVAHLFCHNDDILFISVPQGTDNGNGVRNPSVQIGNVVNMSKQKGRAYRVCVDYLKDKNYCSLRSLITTGDLFDKSPCSKK